MTADNETKTPRGWKLPLCPLQQQSGTQRSLQYWRGGAVRRVEDRTESGLFQTAAVSAATPAVHRNRTQDGLEQKQYEPAGLPRCVLLKKKTSVAGPTLVEVSLILLLLNFPRPCVPPAPRIQEWRSPTPPPLP